MVSLDEAHPSEIERIWMQEAERRIKEFRKGEVQGIPSEDVFRRLSNFQFPVSSFDIGIQFDNTRFFEKSVNWWMKDALKTYKNFMRDK